MCFVNLGVVQSLVIFLVFTWVSLGMCLSILLLVMKCLCG